jgi:hypothetical protein
LVSFFLYLAISFRPIAISVYRVAVIGDTFRGEFSMEAESPLPSSKDQGYSNAKNRSDAVRAERSRTRYTLRSTLSYVDILQGLDIYSSLLLALALMIIYFVNPAEYMFVCSVASDLDLTLVMRWESQQIKSPECMSGT